MSTHNKHILHVEDDETMQLHVKAVLEGLGEVTQANNLNEAGHLLSESPFDLVLLDFTLPDGSGQGLLQQIESLKPKPSVIVLSGHELTKDIPGVEKVLTKGRYKDEDFIKLVQAILYSN